MSDELREAAERVREVRRTNKSSVYACVHPRAFNPFAVDNQLLADAYLAEHPADDDTPIDEAWLRSIGMRQLSETCRIWQIRERYGRLIEAWESEAGWKADVQVESKFPINFPTRGQLRRLCSSLGIELKEGKA